MSLKSFHKKKVIEKFLFATQLNFGRKLPEIFNVACGVTNIICCYSKKISYLINIYHSKVLLLIWGFILALKLLRSCLEIAWKTIYLDGIARSMTLINISKRKKNKY